MFTTGAGRMHRESVPVREYVQRVCQREREEREREKERRRDGLSVCACSSIFIAAKDFKDVNNVNKLVSRVGHLGILSSRLDPLSKNMVVFDVECISETSSTAVTEAFVKSFISAAATGSTTTEETRRQT